MDTVKTAVSLSRSLFEQADELARELNVSRSRLYSLALEEYIRRQENQAMLEQINAVYADEVDAEEEATLAQMRRLHRRVVEGEW
jgi:metal-responsive CopG/Arc/MetJ family transcriptional regulator